jgi:hypothetical protein
MGIIDPHSEYGLYDILDGTLTLEDQGKGYKEPNGTVDFYGFHIFPSGEDTFTVQYDGHAGSVGSFHPDEFDDVLELVDHLMDYVFRAHNYEYTEDKEELVEWAGKIMVDEGDGRAQERPDLYMETQSGI